jgi:hypothetical protein
MAWGDLSMAFLERLEIILYRSDIIGIVGEIPLIFRDFFSAPSDD